jgi:hypothetical protein
MVLAIPTGTITDLKEREALCRDAIQLTMGLDEDLPAKCHLYLEDMHHLPQAIRSPQSAVRSPQSAVRSP